MRSRFLAWAGTLVALACWTFAARAEVTLPNGTVVPRDSTLPPTSNNERQLHQLFAERGENIDFVQDGFPTPDTFSPLCDFKATFLLKESESNIGVGWYNVVPDAVAAPTAIFTIVPTDSEVGTVVSGQSIREHPSYLGGLIGFALTRTPAHYSEAKWNTICSGCATPGPWILSISYRSTVLPNAYYLAFEDGDTSSSSFGNDGDYNDYVFLFEGLACAGDGEPCQVPGAKGVCRDGVQECNNTGELVCKPFTEPSDEVCDGLDNDCDGSVDGDAPCGVGEVCSRGVCVPHCGGAEFACLTEPFFECENGLCVEPACVGKRCDEGQICVAGECRAACDGVTCPVGRVCRFGACVDPCAGVTCSDQRVCVNGACVLDCACAGCGAGQACKAETGLCVAPACVSVSCATGEFCNETGDCADACSAATCPAGSLCQAGECVPAPPEPADDAGTGSVGDDGASPGDDGAAPGDGADGADPDGGSTAGDGDDGRGGATGSIVRESSSCGCRVPGHAGGRAPASLWLLCLGGAALMLRRRRS